eukprot:7400633-Pyramimonas_sp.AAC.1
MPTQRLQAVSKPLTFEQTRWGESALLPAGSPQIGGTGWRPLQCTRPSLHGTVASPAFAKAARHHMGKASI